MLLGIVVRTNMIRSIATGYENWHTSWRIESCCDLFCGVQFSRSEDQSIIINHSEGT